MRCGVGDLGGYQCSDGLGGGYGAAACPRASSGSAGGDQCASMQHHSRLPLTAAPPRRALAKLVGRGQAPAIHPPNPRTTTAAPCPRDALHPRALGAAGHQLEGAGRRLCTLITSQRGTAKPLDPSRLGLHSKESAPVSLARGVAIGLDDMEAGRDQGRRAPAGRSNRHSWWVGGRTALTAPATLATRLAADQPAQARSGDGVSIRLPGDAESPTRPPRSAGLGVHAPAPAPSFHGSLRAHRCA